MNSNNKLNQNSFESNSFYEHRPSIDSEDSQRHSLIKKLVRYSHFKLYSRITRESQELTSVLEKSQFFGSHSSSLSLLSGLQSEIFVPAETNTSNASSLTLEKSSPSSSYSSSNIATNFKNHGLVMKPSSIILTSSFLKLESSQSSDSILSSPLSTPFTNKRSSFFHLNSKKSSTTKSFLQLHSPRHLFSNSSPSPNYNNPIAVHDNISKSEISFNSSAHASSIFSSKNFLHFFSFYKHSPKVSESLDLKNNLSSSALQANIVANDRANWTGPDCKQNYFFNS